MRLRYLPRNRSALFLAEALLTTIAVLLLAASGADAKQKNQHKRARAAAAIVKIVTPQARATVSGKTRIKVRVRSRHHIRSVRFYVDRKLVRTDKRKPFTYTGNSAKFKDGLHRLTAKASLSGNRASYDSIVFSTKNRWRPWWPSKPAPKPPTPAPTPQPDTTPPSAPSGLVASNVTATSATLRWNASSDNVGVTRYEVFRSNTSLGSTTGTSYTIGIECGVRTSFYVRVFDAAGNSATSAGIWVTGASCPVAADRTPPSAPTGFVATSITQSSAILSWRPSTDNVGVTHYDVYRDGAKHAYSPETNYKVTLSCGVSHAFTVVAKDAANNIATSAPFTITGASCSPSADTTPPSAPGGLAADSVTQTSATLRWSPSTDNVGVSGYDIYKGASKLGSTVTPSYNVSLTCGVASQFSVVARDAAGNNSASSPLTVTGAACDKPTPPPTDPPPTSGNQPVGVPGNWKQIWGDEFEGTTLDKSKWSDQRGPSQWPYGDPYNTAIEDAFYKKENVSVRGGNLAMTLKQESANGYPYTSGVVHSGNNFGFKYGFIEARTYVPRCTGCWPAFWMLDRPVDHHWPPEIDIFEYFDTLGDPMAYFNYHYVQGGNKQLGIKNYGTWGGDLSGWHTFGLRWTADRLQTYVDGKPGPAFTDSAMITRAENYVIFNMALQKGKRPPSGQQFLVDYVRVWQEG